MTIIDASQRLTLLLRSQVPAFRQAAGAGQRKTARAASTRAQARDVANIVVQRIQALSLDDPDRKRKAVRIFLESLLLQELGVALADDSSFADMVNAVQDRMQSDARMAAAADELSEVLLAAGPRA